MPTSPFAVTSASNSVSLDAKRHGQAAFTVFNASGRPIRGRARLTPENPEAGGWLSLAGTAERDFPIAGTEQYTVHIAVPRDAPPGSYAFRLDMVGVENPDELFTQGPTITFEVSGAVHKKAFPWWIVLAVIGGLLLCGVLAVGGYLVAKNWPSEEPTPTPRRVPTTTTPPTDTPAPTPTPLGGGTGRIAFVRGAWSGGGTIQLDADVYTMALDDPGPAPLTSNREAIGWLDWSPDGERIAFVRQSGTDFDVFVMSADGTNPQNLTSDFDAFDAEPVWSPNGARIAFSSNRADGTTVQIHVMDADGTNVEQLTSPPDSNSSPAWSPDGNHIAFVSNRSGQLEIYVMNADGTAAAQRTNSSGNLAPSWSPDGNRIAFSHLEAGINSVWVMNNDGSGLTKLMDYGLLPRWSPDGTQIVFSSGKEGDFDLYVMNADGSGKHQLTDTAEHDAFAIWEPSPSP